MTNNLTSPSGRRKLEQRKEPYWITIVRGLALGFYKGNASTSWYVRQRLKNQYKYTVLGIADDEIQANGTQVLNFDQARNKAIDLLNKQWNKK